MQNLSKLCIHRCTRVGIHVTTHNNPTYLQGIVLLFGAWGRLVLFRCSLTGIDDVSDHCLSSPLHPAIKDNNSRQV